MRVFILSVAIRGEKGVRQVAAQLCTRLPPRNHVAEELIVPADHSSCAAACIHPLPALFLASLTHSLT